MRRRLGAKYARAAYVLERPRKVGLVCARYARRRHARMRNAHRHTNTSARTVAHAHVRAGGDGECTCPWMRGASFERPHVWVISGLYEARVPTALVFGIPAALKLNVAALARCARPPSRHTDAPKHTRSLPHLATTSVLRCPRLCLSLGRLLCIAQPARRRLLRRSTSCPSTSTGLPHHGVRVLPL